MLSHCICLTSSFRWCGLAKGRVPYAQGRVSDPEGGQQTALWETTAAAETEDMVRGQWLLTRHMCFPDQLEGRPLASVQCHPRHVSSRLLTTCLSQSQQYHVKDQTRAPKPLVLKLHLKIHHWPWKQRMSRSMRSILEAVLADGELRFSICVGRWCDVIKRWF